MMLLAAIALPTADAAGEVNLRFEYSQVYIDTVEVSLYIDALETFDNLPVFGIEMTLWFHASKVVLVDMDFDDGLLDSWGGMLFSIDSTTGLCRMAGAGWQGVNRSGRLFVARMACVDGSGCGFDDAEMWLTAVKLNETPILTPTDVDDPQGLVPSGFGLWQNYPNPFNPSTAIGFTLPQAADIELTVFNIVGQKVDVLAEGRFASGTHSVTWDASAYPSGVYFYHLATGDNRVTRKMVLLK